MDDKKRYGAHYILATSLLVAILLFVGLKTTPVFASGDDITQSNDMNNQTAGDVSQAIGGDSSKSYGLGFALGDVDINDCLVSKQTNIVVVGWQGYDYNVWCMADGFDQKGLFDMGAKLRCQIPPIRNLFATEQACMDANRLDSIPIPPPTVVARFDEHDERGEERHDQELLQLQEQVQMIEQELQREREARAIAEQAARQVQQYERADEQRRQRALQVLKEGGNE